MKTFELEARVGPRGGLNLSGLPFREGEPVKVSIAASSASSAVDKRTEETEALRRQFPELAELIGIIPLDAADILHAEAEAGDPQALYSERVLRRGQ